MTELTYSTELSIALDIARHSRPELTANIYAKSRDDRLKDFVDKIASSLKTPRGFVKCLSQDDKEGDGDDAISLTDNNLDAVNEWWRRRDSKPLCCNVLHDTEQLQNTNTNITIPCNIRHLQQEGISQTNKTLTLSEHKYDSSLQTKCAVYVPKDEYPLDLQLVCNAWRGLPKDMRIKIVQLVLEVLE